MRPAVHSDSQVIITIRILYFVIKEVRNEHLISASLPGFIITHDCNARGEIPILFQGDMCLRRDYTFTKVMNGGCRKILYNIK